MYHRIIAGELAELWHFCVRNGNPQAAALATAVEKMASFQRWIDQGEGNLPLFGDSQLEDTYYRFSAPSIMAARSAANQSRLGKESPDHTYWLTGGEPASAGLRGDEDKPSACAFPEGGYFVARSGWAHDADVLVWDCGPVGYRQNRKHAHLDALSFTLSVSGTPLLIDPGVHEASGTGVPLRSTRVHTTVCIDGEEQGVLAPRAEIWSPPVSNLLLWAASDECVIMAGQHDGYTRLSGQVRHTRHILVMHGSYWLIIDGLQGAGEHLVEQRFHVVPGARATLDAGGNVVTINKKEASLALSWAGRPTVRIDPGLAELHCGRPEPSCIVTAERKSGLPITLAVACSSGGVQIRPGDEPGRAGWFVVSGVGFEHCVYAGCDTGLAAPLPGGWITDANFAVIRKSTEGGQPDLLLPEARAWREGQEPPPAKSAGEITRMVLC
jgi:hypothetical protein